MLVPTNEGGGCPRRIFLRSDLVLSLIAEGFDRISLVITHCKNNRFGLDVATSLQHLGPQYV